MDLHGELKSWFGYETFRPYQERIIQQVMAGQSTLGVLPTGAGKSLCYQLPALLLPRPTLVISPLIALMQDQLDGLPPAVYPKATLINSSIEPDEINRRFGGIEAGEYSLIYAAPERLRQQGFLRLLQRSGLSLVVVDEAHCVSVWGHDFRPDYLFIRKALQALSQSGEPPTLLALTATATSEMQTEIAAQLGRPLETVAASSFRPNLRLEVFPCANADTKMRRLAAICRETPGAAIVYANSRDRCEQLANFLRGQGLQAAHYHAGLESEERRQTQERFMLGRTRIIVATVAFGMGVDKPNVRLVAHFTLPKSLENYTQEAGRAGRDGKPSRCVLLFAASDKASLSRWLRQEEIRLETVRDTYRALKSRLGRGSGLVSPDALQAEIFANSPDQSNADSQLRVAVSMLERCGLVTRYPDTGRDMLIEMLPAPPNARAELEVALAERRRQAELRLTEMVAYAEGEGCRHARIALHFGQTLDPCGDACDRCLGTAENAPRAARPAAPTVDTVPDLGRALLETLQSLPFTVGRTGLAKILTGAADSPIKSDRCPTYGSLAGFTLNALRGFLDRLIEAGLLAYIPDDEYRRIALTAAGRAALQAEDAILANPNRVASPRPAVRATTSISDSPSAAPALPPTSDEDDRFEQLRSWRRIEAQRASVPPYVIFHDTTLRAIAQVNPTTLAELETISGIGPRKIENYGAAVLALLHGGEETEGEKAAETKAG